MMHSAHHPDITPKLFFHHEQAAAMAAEAYARIAGMPADPQRHHRSRRHQRDSMACFGAWTDSVPMLVVSGQVKRATCLATTPVAGPAPTGRPGKRNHPMVRGITKYASACRLAPRISPGISIRRCTSRLPVGPGRSGSTSRSTCRAQSDRSEPACGASCLRSGGRHGLPPSWTRSSSACVAARRPVILAGSGVRAARATQEDSTR
jgi:acetolactate synthase-1/2/3 large subunit